ncbi:hypothetical protein DFS33DRAFT_1363553 [Desarmillaria ectypa]|nr:hypothetical protein DFS33DRAFT_1363553 [Desarmillaria ectypa]
MDSATFSSTHMRERDKVLNEKHRKEIAAHEAKYDRLKHSAKDTLNRLSDLTNRTGHLVRALGFSDLQEALFVVDNAEHSTKYRDALTRIEGLEKALRSAKDERDHLQAQLDDTAEERNRLREKKKDPPASPSPSRCLLAAQLKALQSRYDELLDKKQRAAAIYKRDYSKWRDFKAFLFRTECKAKSKMEAEKDNEFRRSVFIRLADNVKMLEEIGPLLYADDASYAYEDKNLYGQDKDNQSGFTPMQIPTTIFPPIPSKRPGTPSSPLLLPSASLISAVTVAGPSKTTIPSPPRKANGSILVPSSSDTEEDSLARESSPTPQFKVPFQGRSTINRAIHFQNAKAASLAPLTSPFTPLSKVPNLDIKRYDPRSTPLLSLKQSPSTPTKLKTGSVPPRKVRRISHEHDSPRSTPAAPLGKGKEKEKAASSVSAARTAKQTNDYSAFKGRGRYAKDSKEKTINETFAIDPKRNNGFDFQFDAVVRNKDERRQLHAGDCECCRDYYEGVGPLPKRLKQPLWRSPKKNATPSPARRKKGISRHRYNWAQGGTPPGYWDIGFPDTQEAKNINERAKEMHEKKRTEIEAEAMRGDGRYVRRK